jgi:TolB protein
MRSPQDVPLARLSSPSPPSQPAPRSCSPPRAVRDRRPPVPSVPILGDHNATTNPQQRRSCDPYSISPDGSLIAVEQHTGSQEDGDIGRDLVANTIIDTRTGTAVTLPVNGTINAIHFGPNGGILVRTTNQLTLLNPDHSINSQVAEPSSVKNAKLLAYTK